MDVTKSHADIQRAYRWRLKQENPELLRMREREKWRRQCLKKRAQYTESQNMALMHQDICNYSNRDISRDVSENSDAEVSVKYPIRHLLRWLENVEVDDDVKYGFLKYLYGEKGTAYNNGRPDECNMHAAEGEGRKLRRTHTQDELYYAKRTPIESSSESDVSDAHNEDAFMPLRRKSIKKATKRKNMAIKWEPLCFDTDE